MHEDGCVSSCASRTRPGNRASRKTRTIALHKVDSIDAPTLLAAHQTLSGLCERRMTNTVRAFCIPAQRLLARISERMDECIAANGTGRFVLRYKGRHRVKGVREEEEKSGVLYDKHDDVAHVR